MHELRIYDKFILKLYIGIQYEYICGHRLDKGAESVCLEDIEISG